MTISRRNFLGAAAAASVGSSLRGVAASAPGTPSGTPGRKAAGTPDASARAPEVRIAGDRVDPWIEVDPAALAHNLTRVHRLAPRPVLAVLKNNAYGLGLELVARVLEPRDEIEGFAVVRAAEAVALRDAGVRKPVLLMARAAASDVPDLVARGIALCAYDGDDPGRLAEAVGEREAPVPVHLYLDTGLGRMGARPEAALPLLRALAERPSLRVAGTFMAFVEETDFDREQLARFRSVVEAARREGLEVGRLHAASSNGVFHLPEAHLDAVRPGIALFGGYPSRPEEERAKAELVPAARLRARVARVARLEPGDSVSYGRRYVAERPVWTATLPVGHADGYPREAVSGARVLIGGRTYPVIGAVSASHTIVEVGGESSVAVDDVATLLGPDHPDIHPNGLATTIGVSVYDLLMHLSPLLPRVLLG